MGIFDLFKKQPSNETILDDVIWLTKQAKFDGISKAVARSLDTSSLPVAILLVSHFQDCLQELQTVETSGQWETGHVMATKAVGLTSGKMSDLPLDESQSVTIFVGERHPLPLHEDGTNPYTNC